MEVMDVTVVIGAVELTRAMEVVATVRKYG